MSGGEEGRREGRRSKGDGGRVPTHSVPRSRAPVPSSPMAYGRGDKTKIRPLCGMGLERRTHIDRGVREDRRPSPSLKVTASEKAVALSAPFFSGPGLSPGARRGGKGFLRGRGEVGAPQNGPLKRPTYVQRDPEFSTMVVCGRSMRGRCISMGGLRGDGCLLGGC